MHRFDASKRQIVQLNNGDLGIAEYYRAVADPFMHPPVKAPYSYNEQPSFITSTARMTYTDRVLSVPNGQTATFVFFSHPDIFAPKMASALGTAPASSDGNAFHSGFGYDGANYFHYGAPNYGLAGQTIYGAAGRVWTTTYATNRMDGTQEVLYWDREYPIVGNGTQGHLRGQLTAAGLRIIPKTPLLNRGGEIITVMPANATLDSASLPSIDILAVHPTFLNWDATKTIQLSVIPRVQDEAYWHPVGDLATGTASNPMLIVIVNNQSGQTQSFTLEYVAHYSIAGTGSEQFGSLQMHNEAAKNHAQNVQGILLNGHPTASEAHTVYQKVVSAAKTGIALAADAVDHPLTRAAAQSTGFSDVHQIISKIVHAAQ